MRIAVLGTGPVGRAIAGKLDELANKVVVGTRDVEATLAGTSSRRHGEAFRAWLADHPHVDVAPLARAAHEAEMVVNATNGAASLAVLEAVGEQALADKVLVDVANPLDFSQGFPPSLLVSNTDSLAEQIQRRFPRAKVVKALNTVNAGLQVEPTRLADGDHTMFVSGDDAAAKAQVTGLLRSFGWRDVIDLGDITTARGTEMYLPLWVRLMGVLGTPTFSVKVMREPADEPVASQP